MSVYLKTVRIAIAAVTTGGASDIPAVDEVRVRAASSVSNTSHQREQQTYCYFFHLNLTFNIASAIS